jgi:ribosomal protein S18 acetylase RimI-like enzyme
VSVDGPPQAIDVPVFEALAASFVNSSRALGNPGLVSRERPGFRLAASGGPISDFNRIIVTAASSELEADLEAALDELQGMPALSAWLPAVVATPELVETFTRRGFVEDEPVPAMTAGLDDLPPLEAPAGAQLAFVASAVQAEAALDVMLAGFGIPMEVRPWLLDLFTSVTRRSGSPLRILIATLDGRPVATALRGVFGGTAVIYNVATLPDARGRGFGRFVTLAAMHDAAAHGARRAVLESSEMGRNVYRRLGFREVGDFRVLVRRT